MNLNGLHLDANSYELNAAGLPYDVQPYVRASFPQCNIVTF